MNDTEHEPGKGMVRHVLTLIVIAVILALAYLTFFTPGVVTKTPRGAPATSQGSQ